MTAEKVLSKCAGCGETPTLYRLSDSDHLFSDAMLEVLRENEKEPDPPEYKCHCGIMTEEERIVHNEEESRKKEELGFVLRVAYGDNDFSWPMERACKDFLEAVTGGHVNSEAIERGLEEIEKVGLESIRRSLVMGAVGHYIALSMRQCRIDKRFGTTKKDVYDLDGYKDTLDYLDKSTTVEKIRDFEDRWENSEVAYIDFVHCEVHQQ